MASILIKEDWTYRIAGNFRGVLIFVIFVTIPRVTKFSTHEIFHPRIFSRLLRIYIYIGLRESRNLKPRKLILKTRDSFSRKFAPPKITRYTVVVPDFSEGRELQLDFSATHPCLPTNLISASREAGAAASRREQEKRHRYNDSNGLFEPIVCEHHGHWGVTAIKLLNKLAHSAGESIPCVTHWQFRNLWVKALGISLQKNIAQTMVNEKH